MNHPKNLNIPFLGSITKNSPIEEVSSVLNNLSRNKIEYTPWMEFPYKPDCAFVITHSDNCIFLKFFIKEDDILVRYTQPNDLVYGDSCVEFFIVFDGEDKYYNLEFNSIGTCFLGYGSGSDDMEAAEAETVRKIKSCFKLAGGNGGIKWELTLIIANDVFFRHNYDSLSSKKCKGNFFKCGDDMPVKHYLSWNNIKSPTPNFHLPQFFGDLNFLPPSA